MNRSPDTRSSLPRSKFGFVLLLCATASQVPVVAQQPSAEAAEFRQALQAADQGDLSRAYKLSQDVLLKSPRFEPALRLQAQIMEQSGHNAEAVDLYQRALVMAPEDTEASLHLGILKLVAGDVDAAIALIEKRVKRAPQDGDALYYLAQALHLKGDNDAALKAIRKSVEADASNPSVLQKYGELLCSAGQSDAALEWLTKARNADPTLPRMNFDFAVATYNNQDLEKAQQYATKATQEAPNDLEAVALLAAVAVKGSHWADAKANFEKILSVRAGDAASLLGLGHCEVALKNYAAAVPPLEQLVSRDPSLVLAHFYLARAYAGLGRTTDAERESDVHRKLLEKASSPESSTQSEDPHKPPQ